jgi:hypothetical protein
MVGAFFFSGSVWPSSAVSADSGRVDDEQTNSILYESAWPSRPQRRFAKWREESEALPAPVLRSTLAKPLMFELGMNDEDYDE